MAMGSESASVVLGCGLGQLEVELAARGVSTGAEATQRIAAKKPSQSPGEGEGGGGWVRQVSDSERCCLGELLENSF